MNTYSYERVNNICLIIIACVASITALIYTKIALVPFVISVFLFAVLAPIISGVQAKLRVPKVIAVIICFIVFLLFATLTWILVFQSFKGFLLNIELYKLKAIHLVQEFSVFASSYGLRLQPDFIQQEIQNLPILDWVKSITGNVATFVGNFFLILVFTIFLLLGEQLTINKNNSIVISIRDNISRYIIIKFLSSLVSGLAVCILLLACKVELALVFAFLTFLLNFIPNIGSVIAGLLPLPLILLNSGFGLTFFIVLIGQILIHSIIGTVIEPKFLGEKMDLHPIAILMFLIFWGLVWGIPGMFLAVPITAILKITFSKIESTKPFAELLAGRIS